MEMDNEWNGVGLHCVSSIPCKQNMQQKICKGSVVADFCNSCTSSIFCNAHANAGLSPINQHWADSLISMAGWAVALMRNSHCGMCKLYLCMLSTVGIN